MNRVERGCFICEKPGFCRGWCKQHYRRVRRLERSFYQHVLKGPGCWGWTSNRNSVNRPYFSLKGLLGDSKRNDSGNYKRITAAKAIWIINRGPVPEGLEVCHSCHNGEDCVRFSHLFLGTHQQNISGWIPDEV